MTETQDWPEIHILWEKKSKAHKIYTCQRCGELIEIGTAYESVGLIEDGVFRHEHSHIMANQYPSGCPKFNERDRAELKAQFILDRDR